MLKSFQRTLATLLMIALAIGFYSTPAHAADLLKNAKVTLSEPKASQPSNYLFEGVAKSTGTIKGIRMAFRKQASGSTANPTMTLAAAALNADKDGGAAWLTRTTLVANDWTVDATNAATGILYLKSDTGNAVNSGDALKWQLDGITNPAITNAGAGCQQNTTNASAGTCYILVQTFTTTDIAAMDTQGESTTPTNVLLDSTTISFTVTAEISVSARVDSSLSFTVVGTASGSTAATAGATTTTTDTSTFTNLPFGNLTVGTPKTLAQKLYVKTNANNGYTVKVKSTTSGGQPLKGVYAVPAQNVINPFNNNAGDGTALWGTPANWATPNSTTANSYSGFIGVSTSDTDVWAGTAASGANSNKWAPLNSSANTVMSSTGPDLGDEANMIQITYAIQVNVYQPADNYTGTIQYNCVPVY